MNVFPPEVDPASFAVDMCAVHEALYHELVFVKAEVNVLYTFEQQSFTALDPQIVLE